MKARSPSSAELTSVDVQDHAGRVHAPLVSVVIPACNSARFLGSTLQSVQNQSLEDWECVLVDDGSSDGTLGIALEYAARDPRFRAARIENGGPSAARNHGYRLTNPESEFVMFMDSDDLWLPHALETLRRRLQDDSAAIGAHGLAELIDEAGDPISPGSYPARGRRRLGLEGRRLVEWPLDRPTDFAVLVNGNVLFPPGLVLARRSAYERAGRFDERLRGAEDWDMLIRLSRHGHLAFEDDVILQYRHHGSNLGAVEGIERWAWLVRCKAFHSPDNHVTHQRIARRGWRAYQRYMIVQRWRSGLDHLRARQFGRSVNGLARIPAHIFRFARGYPTPRLVRASEPWEPGAGRDHPDHP
jgi:glycosyltransferase involved in cell wall biosynthesis